MKGKIHLTRKTHQLNKGTKTGKEGKVNSIQSLNRLDSPYNSYEGRIHDQKLLA